MALFTFFQLIFLELVPFVSSNVLWDVFGRLNKAEMAGCPNLPVPQ